MTNAYRAMALQIITLREQRRFDELLTLHDELDQLSRATDHAITQLQNSRPKV